MNQASRTRGTRIAAMLTIGWMLVAAGQPASAQPNFSVNLNGYSRIEVPSAADLMNGTLLTVECWARPAGNTSGRLVSKGDGWNGYSERSYVLAWTAQRFEWTVFVTTNLGLPRWTTITSPTTYPAGLFHHVAGTFNAVAGRSRLYVDGDLVAEAQLTVDGYPLAGATVRPSSQPMIIGFEQPLPASHFLGDLDSVRIWTIERRQADIADEMAFELGPRSGLAASYPMTNSFADLTGNHPGQPVGSPTFAIADWTLAPVFALAGIACNNPAITNPAELTIEAWVFPILAANGRILSIGDSSSVYSERTLELSYSNQQFTAEFFTGPLGTNGYSIASSPTFYSPGFWHHVAATFSGLDGEIRLYVDGEMVALSTSAGTGGPGSLFGTTLRSSPSVPLLIGTDITGTLSFQGSIDEVRIWSYARSAHAIRTGADRILDHQPGQLASLHLNGNAFDSTAGYLASELGVVTYLSAYRLPRFHVAPAVGLSGAFDFALAGIPASAVEGYTVASLQTAFPAGSGAVFGLTPDALTFNLIATAPVATPGNPFHWTAPVSGGLYPNAPFVVPGGALPSGLAIDLLGVAVLGGGGLVPTPVSRITLN